jgi:hypothetical protein
VFYCDPHHLLFTRTSAWGRHGTAQGAMGVCWCLYGDWPSLDCLQGWDAGQPL